MPVGPFLQETDAMAARMIDINLQGVIFGSKLALTRFVARGKGHLVNIASSAGKTGVPGGATYCATKHAVVGLSEAIRGEFRPHGIDVSVVMPVGSTPSSTQGCRRRAGSRPPSPRTSPTRSSRPFRPAASRSTSPSHWARRCASEGCCRPAPPTSSPSCCTPTRCCCRPTARPATPTCSGWPRPSPARYAPAAVELKAPPSAAEPRARDRDGLARTEPVGDQHPDLGAGVLLQEVAGVGDHVRDLAVQRGREALPGLQRQHRV